MRSQRTIPIQPWKPIPAELPFPVLESKLAPAPGRPGLVPRGNLLDQLEASAARPVVAVCAPAGYGKTVLAAAWAKRDSRPFVWLSIDRQDNDPAVLLTYLAVGLDRVEPIDPAVFAALASRGASITQTVVPRLGTALSSKALPVVVVLDDVHLLHDQEGLHALSVLVDHLPQGSQLAVISRDEPPLPLARWRAEGRLAELGPGELAMDPLEAGRLLAAARVELPDGEVAELTRRTEGWPVALYLAALSIKAQAPRNGDGVGLSGRDRFLADYLQSVLLSRLSPTEVQFLTRTAVLDRLSGPLCDAVLDTSGSAAVLASLERSNLLVVPLDRQREWYRYHHLFQELLREELERSEPELVRELTLRAAHWCQRHGLAEAAIDYAIDAGDADLVARGVEQVAISVYRSGRLATVQRWFDWFNDRGLIQQYPAVAMLGAWVQALGGHAAAAERWAAAAEQGSYEGTLPDGSSIDGWRALLRAKLCRHGVTQMRADAELALTLIPVDSLWRAPAQLQGPGGNPPREGGPSRPRPGAGPAAAATSHPCPALLRGPSPAGADPRLPGPHRRGQRSNSPTRGRRPAPVAARPRHPSRPGRPAPLPTRPPRRRCHRDGIAHHRRAAAAASAPHPPLLPRDRPASAPLPAHREIPGPVDLPQARCLLPRPSGPARPHAWLACSLELSCHASVSLWDHASSDHA
jgi:LuxR family transcriptional regulator, maltose regulon positive regulatory protein